MNLKMYYKGYMAGEIMTNEELVQLYQEGNKRALDKLIEKNKGIVNKLVNKFYVGKTNSIDIEDLQQEGFIGLIIAANKYDFNNASKAKFITYAIYWIYHKIQRFIENKNTNEEISLNIPVGEEDNKSQLLDIIEDESQRCENIIDEIYNMQLKQELEGVMKQYNTLMESEILKLYFGWNNNECMAIPDISALFNITGNETTSIKNKALRKMRQAPIIRERSKKYFQERFYNRNCNINEKLRSIDFQQKYMMPDGKLINFKQ